MRIKRDTFFKKIESMDTKSDDKWESLVEERKQSNAILTFLADSKWKNRNKKRSKNWSITK